MTNRELAVLGTASAAPTRDRNQNGYVLKWEDHLILFDPGEGFQRQCLKAGIAIARADAMFISHFHGDHCLGTPGVLHRRMLERPEARLPVYFPADGTDTYDHLVRSTNTADPGVFDPRPVDSDGHVGFIADLEIRASRLQHPVPTYGYRLSEPDSTHLDSALLEEWGVRGPEVAVLERDGHIQTARGRADLGRFILPRPGQAMAFVMDTRLCDAAFELAAGVDLLVCEATYLDADRDLALAAGHMTAADAGRLAHESGARRLILTHFSQRYDELGPFSDEAGKHHPDVVVAREFDRIPVPSRHDR